MATYTTNYNLKKPADSDFINIADLNGNADIIDEELKKRPVVGSDGKLPDNLLPDLSETYEEKGAANTAVSTHNTSPNAHNDIRVELGKYEKKGVAKTELNAHNTSPNAHNDIRVELDKKATKTEVSAHNTSTNAHNDIRVELGKKAPVPIIGTTPPTTSTVGVVGQEYIDTAAKLVYHCTAAGATGYTWISADKNLQDTKQDKSTAITTSNIASQTVNKAKYATDGVAVGTPALRNQYFASAEATPTVNGQICWVYG